jgi:hypothetical protein
LKVAAAIPDFACRALIRGSVTGRGAMPARLAQHEEDLTYA